jgi:hypothetical protein
MAIERRPLIDSIAGGRGNRSAAPLNRILPSTAARTPSRQVAHIFRLAARYREISLQRARSGSGNWLHSSPCPEGRLRGASANLRVRTRAGGPPQPAMRVERKIPTPNSPSIGSRRRRVQMAGSEGANARMIRGRGDCRSCDSRPSAPRWRHRNPAPYPLEQREG